ncbi:MAG: phosphotransferase family protein [Kiritimatiellia bacterium]|nr:phosphotransferase family protein [Pseudomonadales bacterium]MDP6473233.1 phosphotransferase family protein [Pseudomonadales bacterium]MDP6829158.1 phosphotransferase family protein [Pseudomonadales bacterium]MDP7024705.1 phosphotransferase family protein [Kiritimatiellia bacterium]
MDSPANIVRDADFNARIVAYLRRQLPQAQDLVATVLRIMGGRSWDVYGVQARWQEDGEATATDFVFRVAPPGGILEPHDPSLEFRLIDTYARNGLPVPKTYWLELDPAVLGQPFYVMEWIRDEIPELDDPRFDDPAEKQRYGLEFAGTLAKIHSLDWRAEKLDEFLPPGTVSGEDPIDREIAWCEARVAEFSLPPNPGLRAVFQWLRANRPRMREEDQRLVYGDYRFDNFFWCSGRITALLDFEMALIGHPMEDIAFARFLSGWAGIHGDQIRHYEDISGITVDEDLVAYFMVLKHAQINVIVGLAGLDAINKGRVKDSRALSLANGAHVQSSALLGAILQAGGQ